MMHHPISISSLGLTFPQKVCFSGFSCQIHPGMRIAIIGRNGTGKSTLLKMLQGCEALYEGTIQVPRNVTVGYVPQVINEFDTLSGGQRFNVLLSRVMRDDPNILLLDEPTNHLDRSNRQSLMHFLQKYQGTLVMATHDIELLRTCVSTFWHIDQGKIAIFSGHYDDYVRDRIMKRKAVEDDLRLLYRQRKRTHEDLMREQKRSKKSKEKGRKKRAQGHWPILVAGGKQRQAQETMGRKSSAIHVKKQELIERLEELRLPEIIKPKFSLKVTEASSSKAIVTIKRGTCGYECPLVEGIFLTLEVGGRLAITGDNGTGKSTLVRAIMGDDGIRKIGEWLVPKAEDIGYLDQHYLALNSYKTVIEAIQEHAPLWSYQEVREHLNDFLFRKTEEVNARIKTLSGGEKARLSLAQIAAKAPKLLILDEVTNNLDLDTQDHVIQVLKEYPGTMIIISHDDQFLQELNITALYDLGSRKKG